MTKKSAPVTPAEVSDYLNHAGRSADRALFVIFLLTNPSTPAHPHPHSMKPTRKPPAKRKAGTRVKPRNPQVNGKVRKSLGSRVKQAREEARMTQLALAHAIGYSGSNAGAYICRVENDTENPRLKNIQLIANALGVSVCSLLP